MASYKMDMTSYAELGWQAGTVASRPYLLCLECGQHWFLTESVAHLLRADHDPVCPATLWQRERYRTSSFTASPVLYDTKSIDALP